MGFGNSQEISGNIYKFLRRLGNWSSFFLIPMCNFYLFDYCATYNCVCCHEQLQAIHSSLLKLWQHVTMLIQGCNQTQIQLSSSHHHHPHHHHHPLWLLPCIVSAHHGLNDVYAHTVTTTWCTWGSATTLTWPQCHVLHDPPPPAAAPPHHLQPPPSTNVVNHPHPPTAMATTCQCHVTSCTSWTSTCCVDTAWRKQHGTSTPSDVQHRPDGKNTYCHHGPQ